MLAVATLDRWLDGSPLHVSDSGHDGAQGQGRQREGREGGREGKGRGKDIKINKTFAKADW